MTDHRTNQGSGDRRLPPHNLEAERAALGAALLHRTAAETLVESVDAGDFYRPAHQHIARAISELTAEPDPQVDAITVAERIRRAGHLDDIGGFDYLIELQSATPAISAAHRYAKIVKDTAVLRRLIGTASEIAELGYRSNDDPSAAVARAGELLNGMSPQDATSLSTLEVADLAQLLASDLQPERPTILARTDGAALLYPGKMHVFQSEPSTGKTWIGLVAVVEILAMGGAAGYLDYEDTPAGIVTRLLALGASPSAIADRFYYAQPVGRFGPAERLDLARALDRLNLDLVVIDSVGESLSREGLSEDKADDVIRWTDLLPRPIARTGAAVLMLDHVAKDPEQRGRWARGSGAKLAAVDGATYQLKIRGSFSRHKAGRIDFVVAKDRPGGVGSIGETVAVATITPHAGGERLVISVDPYTAELAPTDGWKPTVVMGKVHAVIDSAGVPLTAREVAAQVHSKPRLVSEAISRLLAEGFIGEQGKRPKTLRILKPYTESPALAAPAWRQEPPEELELDLDVPTAAEALEASEQLADLHHYDHPDF